MRPLALAFACLLSPAPATACEVALVLAMDVSRSVDAEEFTLIRHGTAEAFRNPEITGLITWLEGGILVTVTQWSGATEQEQSLPWTRLRTNAEIGAFADQIDAIRRTFRYELTAPGEALDHAAALLEDVPETCRRNVIDIAGDGVRNTGLETAERADLIEMAGITINGLVVRGDTPDPLEFYQTEIKRGALSFIEVAENYNDFGAAMFRKLLRELTPSLSQVME
jgi:Ca-activated chloride channel family protein